MRRILGILLLSGCASLQSPRPSYRTIDLMPLFWSFWAEAHERPFDSQIALFESRVVPRHPEIYNAAVLGFDRSKPFHEELAKRYPRYMAFVSADFPTMRRLSNEITHQLGSIEARFLREFPDFDYHGDIYFMNSLAAFDGAVREVNGKRALLFGLDVIAAIHGQSAAIEPLFDHELFHLYHHQSFPRREALWAALWTEGLATYVSRRMNPAATDRQIFGLPENTPTRTREMLPRIAHELVQHLDSPSRDDYRKFFLGSEPNADPPQRSGYYVGYLIAERIGRDRRLRDLAKMPPDEVRRTAEEVLRSWD
ncbi:MAG TPA: DUF2268 domain-containing putative Zn-dependent protease [Thermoanaerobaculia bacterium]|jgi:hypothetical protein|nr:DUF2268 domain-containing putative Zn-dependent protease [Thermoanaerobaculia bacterium]